MASSIQPDNICHPMSAYRHHSPFDSLITGFDKALRVVGGVASSSRPNPGAHATDCELSDEERRHSAGLMRVNHVGEVCAQALYDAQARFGKSPAIRAMLSDRSDWCASILGGRASARRSPRGWPT